MKIVCAPLEWTEKEHLGPMFSVDEPGNIPYPYEFLPIQGKLRMSAINSVPDCSRRHFKS